MKKILFTLGLLLAIEQGAWATPQTWTSGNTICTLDDQRVFTVTAIPGTDGVMADYPSISPAWQSELSSVSKVVVEEGVTVIGQYTLPNLPDVEISLPNTLKEIRTDAFRYGDMTKITIPSSVTRVAAGAFYVCSHLADVYCYASPYSLTWGSTKWDFIHNPEYWTYATRMHVKATNLEAFLAKFTGTRQLNVTFVGDILPSDNWIDHRAETFSDENEVGKTLYIHNEAELALLAYKVNQGTDYKLYSIVLEEDLDLSDYYWTPIGTAAHPFKTFEFNGNGHTIRGLYVNNPESDYNGLFGYVYGQERTGTWPEDYLINDIVWIKNFKLLGSIVKGRDFTGGVVGYIYGLSHVEEVYCDAQVSGRDCVGGLVGKAEGQYNPAPECFPYISNNAYVGSGSITSTGTSRGIVVGLVETSAHVTENYYINPAVTPAANQYDELLYPIRTSNIPSNVSLSITATKSLEWNGIKYIGSNSNDNTCDLTITVRGGYSQNVTDVSLNGTTIASGDGSYTLQPIIGSASEFVVTVTAYPTGIEGKGTEDEPYIIDTQDRWNTFANLVSTGHSSTGLYFRLDSDITITTMAGAPSPEANAFGFLGTVNSFSGIFDGNSHTLTLDYNASEDFAAPFRYVYGATIKNLHVAGSISTSAQFAAGIIGHASGYDSHLNNCQSSVTINSSVVGDGTHGGLVAYIFGDYLNVRANMNISGCIFNGKLLGSSTTHCGGLVGYAYGGQYCEVSLNDCLFAPAEVTFGTDNSATLLRFGSSVSINNSFYTVAFGSTQDIPPSYALTTLPANFGTLRTTYSVSGITAYTGGIPFGGKYYVSDFGFYNDASNIDLFNEITTSYNGQPVNVRLCDRTLFLDGSWNTLCLPFSLTSSQIFNYLRDWFDPYTMMLMELDVDGDHDGRKTGLASDGTLYLYFKNVNSIEAGKPYIIKWGTEGTDKVNPYFGGVIINNATPTPVTSSDGKVSFVGTFNPYSIEADDKSMLYLGAGSMLYYPEAAMTIGAFRAFFRLNGITAGDPSNGVRAFALSFGDEDSTQGVSTTLSAWREAEAGAWYSLDGRRLSGKPAQRGIYINKGVKVVIK